VEVSGFEAERLEVWDWHQFDKLGAGQTFILNGRVWRKHSSSELKRIVGQWVWTVVHPE
jgi:hypothetical protein